MAAQNIADTIKQLNAARNLALADPALYPQIVPGLLRIVGADAILELRRWGADFFAETFASPVLASDQKQNLSLIVLDTLKGFLDNPNEDISVIKSVIQTAASIYPLVFRHIISNPNDAQSWQKMAGIKSSILRRMDSLPPGARICCVKFIQKVVQTQTPGLIADPRRPDMNEISLALVPRDHPVIPPNNLEAEASGLLDRLLGVLQDNSSDALLVTATLNCLGSLVKLRASIAIKIVTTVLSFNPLLLAQTAPVTMKTKVVVRSMARTTMTFLNNIIKKNPQHPMAGRIQQGIDRIRHSLPEALEDHNRKRPAPAEPTDGLSEAKRQRVDAQVPPINQALQPPSLPPGPVSYAQLFTLTREQGLKSFDVNVIPLNILQSIVVPLLASIDKGKMDHAINTVRARYLEISRPTPANAALAARAATGTAPIAGPAEEDDEYEPGLEDTEQVLNDLDQAPTEEAAEQVALGPFNLPPPPPLTPEETAECSKGAINRVFENLAYLDQTAPAKPSHSRGFNSIAAGGDRDSWITVVTRLATRASAGLEDTSIKGESSRVVKAAFSPNNAIRDALYMYVIEDFRRRIGVAIAWLNEEWYNDRVVRQSSPKAEYVPEHYEKWMLKTLDGIMPFIESNDRNLLIRFLSEVPALNEDALNRVVRLASDPERVQLVVLALTYLIMYRPPVKKMGIDALEELYKNYDDSRPFVTKLLTKYRPEALQDAQTTPSAA
ncbi:hypothetical protein AAFC00_002816 [Neodothiora populina]|uniref:Symplekin/Pta1 N-terminal domain-containing protein n=1 Tax=Neodothiora populina TaxID=2781224 RepID=A0ABR3P928_9PEZI